MSATVINAENVSQKAFAPFGNVMQARGEAAIINDGYAERYGARAQIEAAADGKTRVHFFAPRARIVPLPVTVMERHPRGSQCFIPLGNQQWLAVAAGDDNNKPAQPRGFYMQGDTGLRYAKNTWHCPLLSLSARRFAVVDNGYGVDDLELHLLNKPVWVNADIAAGDDNGNDIMFANNPAKMSEDEFVNVFANVAEESPWVAEQVWRARGAKTSAAQTAQAFALAILQADEKAQMELVQKHPRLGADKLDALSTHSQNEQTQAGLAKLGEENKNEFAELNGRYEKQFGFPFVCAVAGMNAPQILAQLKHRIGNNATIERAEALYQIFVIIRRRLETMASAQS